MPRKIVDKNHGIRNCEEVVKRVEKWGKIGYTLIAGAPVLKLVP